MPAKQVLQYECGRCQRVWYVEQGQSEVLCTVDVTASFAGAGISIKFDCLCEGCSKTVKNLLEAIGKAFKKSAPQRRARKKKETADTAKPAGGEGETSPPADLSSPLPPKVPSTLHRVDSPPAVDAGAAGAAHGGKGSQSAANRSTR